MLRRAELLLHQRRPQDAEEVLRDYMVGEPDDVAAHVLLTQSLLLQERPKAALESAERAVGLDPTWSHTHWVKGRVLLDLDERKGARLCAEQAIELEPEDPDNYGLSAQVYVSERNWKDAIVEAEHGLSLDPNHSLCRHLLSHSLTKSGKQGVARESLEAGLADNPMDPDAHVQLGFQSLHVGDTDRALEAFEEALRLDADHEGARDGLVESLKARNPIYSLILRGFLKLGSMPGNSALYLLVGFFVLHRVARSLGKSHPDWKVFLDPITWLYIAFAGITWFAESFFDVLLLCSRQGRMALAGNAKRRTYAFAAALAVIATCGVMAVVNQDSGWLMVAGLVLMAQVPVVSAFNCNRPSARHIMMIVSIACNLFIVAGLAVLFLGGPDDVERGLDLVFFGGIGGALSSWLGMALLMREH
jgi:Flp pilus assembly protein TadD